ncbi:lachesin-like isoform X6 [Topomyia yanbarensis]|uniref:lachesin-like isoform X6 n=1 Tax=Topomyia yanbarensis TaxID=2498891 RepID=UPI00273AFF0E|nr:lachesin-like isoform X6 [Topomyia yanbarensis]
MVKAETRISVVTGTGPRSKSSDKIMNNSTLRSVLLALLFCLYAAPSAVSSEVTVITDPKFSAPIANVTAAVGREATLTCVVHDLGAYKVAWLRVDTQTILTIQNHVITKNKRIGIIYTEKKTWQLRIRDIRESDKGWYMCQINTDPMKSQMGYLDVVVPPDILDYPTSTDMVVREGSNVTLRCAATGSPAPAIVWRREGGENISLQDGELVPSIEGPTFSIPKVNRLHMGAYLCIASNGVPPSVSKRVMLIVHFPPMIWVPNQLVGAVEGQRMTLECHSEAYPKSINYWTREKGDIVPQDKSRKGHAFYETNDVLEDDTESSNLIVGGRNDESYEISSSVAFCFPLYRLHTLLFVSFSLLLTALQPTV